MVDDLTMNLVEQNLELRSQHEVIPLTTIVIAIYTRQRSCRYCCSFRALVLVRCDEYWIEKSLILRRSMLRRLPDCGISAIVVLVVQSAYAEAQSSSEVWPIIERNVSSGIPSSNSTKLVDQCSKQVVIVL